MASLRVGTAYEEQQQLQKKKKKKLGSHHIILTVNVAAGIITHWLPALTLKDELTQKWKFHNTTGLQRFPKQFK